MPYISHSHFTVFPTSNFPLDFVNQKLVVIVGSIIAWKTCETGFLISICVSTVGILFVILCYLLKVQISVFIGLSYNDRQRLRIWPVADFGERPYPTLQSLRRATKLRMPTSPAIGYMRCCVFGIFITIFFFSVSIYQKLVFFESSQLKVRDA